MRIRIKDKRRGIFTVDNVVLNHYGKAMGATGIALYVTLCRFANNQDQTCYPSITKIREETDMHRDTIIETAERLEKLQLIKKEVTPGKWTVYTLLEPYPDGEPKDQILGAYNEWLTSRKLGLVGKEDGTSRILNTTSRKLGHKRTKVTNLENELNISIDIDTPKKEISLSPEIKTIWDSWVEQVAPITTDIRGSEIALNKLVSRYGLEEVVRIVQVVAYANADKYSGKEMKCYSPTHLISKWDSLYGYAKGKATEIKKKGIPGE